MEQARAVIDALNARMVKLDARALELETQLRYSASQVVVPESEYSLPYELTQMLKQRLATGVTCDKTIEQSLSNARKDVMRYVNALHSIAVKSQNTFMESFCGSFATLV